MCLQHRSAAPSFHYVSLRAFLPSTLAPFAGARRFVPVAIHFITCNLHPNTAQGCFNPAVGFFPTHAFIMNTHSLIMKIVLVIINKTFCKVKLPTLLQGQAFQVLQRKFLLVLTSLFQSVKFFFVKNLAIQPTHRFLVA